MVIAPRIAPRPLQYFFQKNTRNFKKSSFKYESSTKKAEKSKTENRLAITSASSSNRLSGRNLAYHHWEADRLKYRGKATAKAIADPTPIIL